MEFRICIDNINETERFILMLNIGVIEALKQNLVSVNEAENYLYNLATIDKLTEFGISEKIQELIYRGCEIEDVESLLPMKLERYLENIQYRSLELFKETSRPELPAKKWI